MAEEEIIEEAAAYTPADQWPKDDGGQDLTLPSGAKVRVASPPVLWMAMTGRVPAFLKAIVAHHKADSKDFTPEENDKMLDWLICESVISDPKVTLTKKADCLHISKMSVRDKEVIALTLRLQTYAGALG